MIKYQLLHHSYWIEWEDKGLSCLLNSEGGVRNLLPNTFEGTRLTFLQNLVDKLKLKYDK